MRYYLLAAVAAAAIASPAMARDGSMYVGLEAGPMWISSETADYQGETGSQDGSIRIKHKLGLDADAIAGYDFGFVRADIYYYVGVLHRHVQFLLHQLG